MSVDKEDKRYLEKSEEIEIARQAYLHREDIREYEQEMLTLKRVQIAAMERTIYWQRLQMCAVLVLAFVLVLWLGFVLVKVIPTASF